MINIKIIIIPSFLPICFLVFATIYNTNADRINIAISIIEKPEAFIVPNIATGSPKTIQILNILLPIILPTNSSSSPFFEDAIDVISSGSDVPKAIIVRPIILSLIPNTLAIDVEYLTTRLLP